MKIHSFSIENFKSLENVSVNECSNFHALIGANSAGKTSIFDALNLIKLMGQYIPNPQLVTKGIHDFEQKSIVVDLRVDLDDDERRNYLLHLFHIVKNKTEQLLATNALRKIHLKITILVYGDKIVDKRSALLVFPSLLEITTDGGNIVIVYYDRGILNVKGQFASNNDLVDRTFENYLKDVGYSGNIPENSNPHNPSLFLGAFLRDLIANIRYIEAIRETHKIVATSFFDQEAGIGQRGEQLANFMDTLWTNQNEQYLEIEKYCKAIFPNIEKIRPKKLPNNQIILEVHKKNIEQPITLNSDGRGLDQALVVIWRIATSPEKTIWLVDEPEIHLHPGAQKLLYEFFQNQIAKNKQIFVSTHSMVFIHRCEEKQISILLYKDGVTELSSLQNLVNAETTENVTQNQAREIVYGALGYDSSQSLEYTTIVAVEGKTDEKILKIFANILEKPIDEKLIKFVPVGNKNDAKRFAPILKYAVSKRTIIILDNDNQDPTKLKEAIQNQENEYKKKSGIQKSILKEDEFCFYDEDAYSIEYYLLNADIIGKIGNLDENSIEKIRKKIIGEQAKPKKDREKPKNLLVNIWSDFGLGKYDDETSEKIAKNLPKFFLLQFSEISKIIDKINGNYSEQ